MKKTFKGGISVGGISALVAVLLVASLLVTGCVSAPDNDGDEGSGTPGQSEVLTAAYTPYSFATPADYRTMVSLAGGTITGSGSEGVFPAGRTVTLSPFTVAKYETTYQLWKEVYDWAILNGYTIASPGVEGHGTDGTGTVGTAAERATRPVTAVSRKDAIVWCNAYSEMSGKEAVYYTDDSYTNVLKESTGDSGAGKAANGANGYRLPTEAEWEYAARGGDQSDGTNWAYTYPGSNTIGDVAWYRDNSYNLTSGNADYGAHPVGTKAANSKGLYDMSGNVWEWCGDRYSTISASTPVTGPALGVGRGGSFGGDSDAVRCMITTRHDGGRSGYGFVGFRVVCP